MLLVMGLLLVGSSVALAKSEPWIVALPGMDWAVAIKNPDFELVNGDLRPDGLARGLSLINAETNVRMVAVIEPAVSQGDNRVVRDYYWQATEALGVEIVDVIYDEQEPFAISEFFIPEANGVVINSKHVNAYLVVDSFWVSIRMSKIYYEERDRRLLNELLSSLVLLRDHRQSPLDHLGFASAFYLQGALEMAIMYYEKALNTTSNELPLTSSQWRVAVDNLGMSYGIIGDLANSKRVLESGIEQDPTYPMFHYNLACTYAEMDDRSSAIVHLRQAFEYKANMIAGEIMPNPREDASFYRYLSDPDFVTLLAELEKQPPISKPEDPNR